MTTNATVTAASGRPLRTPKASSGPPIELRHVHRWFGSTHAVNDVSFIVEKGEVFGYIGPNGAGKTTSMRILSTLDEPSSGDASVDGFSVIDDPDRVRSRLGFMPDYFGAYQNVNVWEYLDFFARAYGLRGTERRRAIESTMDFTGLDELARKPIDGLSKGMKQRLCLGRTMIHDPSVMVLDEPAAGLDPRARIELREMISRLAEAGKAILISSHILTELAEICDRVAIIERGQLIAVGTVDEISGCVEEEITVRLRVTNDRASHDQTAVIPWLSRHAHVKTVVATKEGVTFHLVTEQPQRDATLAGLLAELIGAGFGVTEFTSRGKSLEDVFLHVTKGRVQ
ncbi:putative ABC transporter ATP-binding protein YbhF [Botrimarina colliarenosi]|uniref:Putative ABC transporter ATP-binding protein YbhF n=1 Tax=Botrimarina colliarenosi TaxID=2528001 RepID=A0A5C6AHZ7_9BACT|nr:ABC transporter ATP-binding protein [Botrimarina colliarenosi]TWT97863.1 putative ABC transporter ATP-binding protein YbhF [Botrimarina colliarenosi]